MDRSDSCSGHAGIQSFKSIEKKSAMLERAIAVGRDALEPAETSGYPEAKLFVHLHLSSRLRTLAQFESSFRRKKETS